MQRRSSRRNQAQRGRGTTFLSWGVGPGSGPPAPQEEAVEASPVGEETEGQAEESELKGVYVISVAARLLNMHPQTLRKYERLGLVRPSRTEGMLRLYSEEDIARLRIIKHLVDEVGLNLAGVEMMLEMLRSLMEMHWRLHSMARDEQVWEILEERLTQLLRPFTMSLDEP